MVQEEFSEVTAADRKLKVSTLLYQGIFTTQTFHTRYTQKRLPTTSSSHWMFSKGRNGLKPLDVLINPFIGTEPPDVNQKTSFSNLLHLLTNLALRFSDWYYGVVIEGDADTKESVKNYSINISEISIGQENDINAHQNKYNLWKKQCLNHKLILWGVSRGAATTFISAAKYPEVSLVVLEGCFHSIDDLIERAHLKKFANVIHRGLSLFTKYKADGPSPHQYVTQFPKHVPIAFITSEKDIVVPAASTERLVKELMDAGHKDVYLLKLKKSTHPNYMYDNEEDRRAYERFINAFYQRYGYPHDAQLAQEGKELLLECFQVPKQEQESFNSNKI